MSAIDDTRKVLQDFLAPELRELKARLDTLEKRIDERFEHAEKVERSAFDGVNERFKEAERRGDLQHAAVIAEIRGISNYNELRERIAKLESSREAVHQ